MKKYYKILGRVQCVEPSEESGIIGLILPHSSVTQQFYQKSEAATMTRDWRKIRSKSCKPIIEKTWSESFRDIQESEQKKPELSDLVHPQTIPCAARRII